MARNLVKINQISKILTSFQRSVLTNIRCAPEIHLERPVGSQALPSEMTRVQWRKHNWSVDVSDYVNLHYVNYINSNILSYEIMVSFLTIESNGR